MNRLLHTLMFTLLSTNAFAVSQVAPTPQVRVVPDAKIVQIDGNWVVILSDKTPYFIKNEDRARFITWMSSEPIYTFESKNFCQIIDVNTQETFILESQELSTDLWILALGNERFHTLNSVDGDALNLISKESPTRWKFTNMLNQHIATDWNEGDIIVTLDVFASSRHNLWRTIGFLLYRFESENDAENFVNFMKNPNDSDSNYTLPSGYFAYPFL